MGSKKATPAEEYATDEEVVAAIRSLTDADGVRLRKVARFRARGLAGLGLGLSADDLLQEAIKRTLGGTRRWRKKVPFVMHLSKTIRSISSHAPDELKDGVVVPASSGEDSDGRHDGVALVSLLVDPERAAAVLEQFTKLERKFTDDAEVALVLEGLASGMKGPEIQHDLQITETQYETIMTRLRRGVDREQGWRP
jgi:hypothetical protein